MKKIIFTTTTLPSGRNAVVYEAYGLNFFRASLRARGEPTQLMKYMLVELLEVDGLTVTEDDVDAMPIRDVVHACEVIGLMFSNGIPGLHP